MSLACETFFFRTLPELISIVLCLFYNCLFTCLILLLNSELLKKGAIRSSRTYVSLSPTKFHAGTQYKMDHLAEAWHCHYFLCTFNICI